MPTPTPIVVTPPQSPSYPITNPPGSVASVSGLSPGPHFIIEQMLDLEYCRVPNYEPSTLDIPYGLKSELTLSDTIHTTPLPFDFFQNNNHKLLLKIKEVRVRKYISYDTYDTSVYEQKQKFEVLSTSTDGVGNTYVGTYDASTLGPRGEIRTKQPYISRVPYDPTNPFHVESDEHHFGGYNYTTVFFNPQFQGGIGTPGGTAQLFAPDQGRSFPWLNSTGGNNWQMWKRWVHPGGNVAGLEGADQFGMYYNTMVYGQGIPVGCCPNPYSPDSESKSYWYDLLEHVGWKLFSGSPYKTTPNDGDLSEITDWQYTWDTFSCP